MRTRFLHMADCHLGYRQYNLTERFNDFGRAFLQVIDTAVEEKVDFVLLAGDLFHKRAIDALTLNQAVAGLERLNRAGIPCIAVEGNHEHAYLDDFIGWLKFLALREHIYLLDTEFHDGKPQLAPYTQRAGSYIDPAPGVRVHGLRYMGAGAKTAIAAYADAMAELPNDGIEFSIFMTHAGIEGEVDAQMSGLSMADWRPLRAHADYVALGHIHKPFSREEWLYNPGSLENCSSAEATWHDRGYYLVDVDTEDKNKHTATLHANRRRPFVRLQMKTDLIESPEQLYAQARELMERRARDIGINRLGENERPVVDLSLHGVLHFERAAVDLSELQSMVREIFAPLHEFVRNATRSSDFAVESVDEGISRPELERQVLADLFARDARFQRQSAGWARAAISIKNLMLQQADAETVLEELAGQIDRLGDETDLAGLGAAAHEAVEQELAEKKAAEQDAGSDHADASHADDVEDGVDDADSVG